MLNLVWRANDASLHCITHCQAEASADLVPPTELWLSVASNDGRRSPTPRRLAGRGLTLYCTCEGVTSHHTSGQRADRGALPTARQLADGLAQPSKAEEQSFG
jgi:hypothetical protein